MLLEDLFRSQDLMKTITDKKRCWTIGHSGTSLFPLAAGASSPDIIDQDLRPPGGSASPLSLPGVNDVLVAAPSLCMGSFLFSV